MYHVCRLPGKWCNNVQFRDSATQAELRRVLLLLLMSLPCNCKSIDTPDRIKVRTTFIPFVTIFRISLNLPLNQCLHPAPRLKQLLTYGIATGDGYPIERTGRRRRAFHCIRRPSPSSPAPPQSALALCLAAAWPEAVSRSVVEVWGGSAVRAPRQQCADRPQLVQNLGWLDRLSWTAMWKAHKAMGVL